MSDEQAPAAGVPGYFIADDDYGNPCVWRDDPERPDYPALALEGWQLHRVDPDLWAAIVELIGDVR